jgi:hypothetical protein
VAISLILRFCRAFSGPSKKTCVFSIRQDQNQRDFWREGALLDGLAGSMYGKNKYSELIKCNLYVNF